MNRVERKEKFSAVMVQAIEEAEAIDCEQPTTLRGLKDMRRVLDERISTVQEEVYTADDDDPAPPPPEPEEDEDGEEPE